MNLWLTGSLGAVYLHNLHEKRITESQDGRNFASARPRWVICTRVTTLQSSFTRNALVSSQTHERNFFHVYQYVVVFLSLLGTRSAVTSKIPGLEKLSKVVWSLTA